MPSADNPNLPAALTADFLHQRLQIDKKVCISTNILTNLINHKQKPEIIRFCTDVFFHLRNKLRNASLHCLCSIEPITGSLFTHSQYFLQRLYNIIFKKDKGIPGFKPRSTVFFFKYTLKLFTLAALLYKLLQLCHLQVFTIESKVVIEHFRKHTEHGGLILIDRTFNINVEQNSVSMPLGYLVNQHESCWVVLKFLAKSFYCTNTLHFPIFKQIRQHLQKVRFTTSEEAGNPNTDIGRLLLEGCSIVIKKGDKMLF